MTISERTMTKAAQQPTSPLLESAARSRDAHQHFVVDG
jgi:hypothetical protein